MPMTCLPLISEEERLESSPGSLSMCESKQAAPSRKPNILRDLTPCAFPLLLSPEALSFSRLHRDAQTATFSGELKFPSSDFSKSLFYFSHTGGPPNHRSPHTIMAAPNAT